MSIFARLTIIQGPDKGKDLKFSTGVITVGRFPSSDLAISDNDMGVSWRHLEIRFRKGNYYLYNYGQNGAFVNGRVVQEGLLEDGDQIGIGFSTVLQFRLEGVTEFGIKPDQEESS